MATKYVQTTEHRPKGRHENNHNPIFDTVLQAAVKKQEELLQASAPHFGYAPGATLILTVRRDASNAFNHMSEAERLFAHAGIALSWGDTPLRRALAEFDEAEQWSKPE